MAAGYDGQSLTFLAPGPVFVKVNFSMDLQGSVPGRFKLITFPVHFIPILTTLAPSEIQLESLMSPALADSMKLRWQRTRADVKRVVRQHVETRQ